MAAIAMAKRGRGPKKIHQSSITGQQGINLIEEQVLAMKYVWTPSIGSLEAGIDGTIEIRDSGTGDMLHSIVRVQSRATAAPFSNDNGRTFDYLCEERDLDYWLRGNTPVILVRSRTDTREAYWVSLKDYFKDPERRKARRVVFDKTNDRFDPAAAPSIARLALPADSGLYLSPTPKSETLYSNLLPITGLPTRLFHAITEHGSRRSALSALREIVQFPQREFVVHGKTMVSVHDLSEHPWKTIVDEGTVEEFETQDWSASDDPQKRRDFVELLLYCLIEKLRPEHVAYHEKKEYFYVTAPTPLKSVSRTYPTLKQHASREVFTPYYSTKEPGKLLYCRHSAFVASFVEHDGTWYLEVEPTYHFTRDGRRGDMFGASRLSGIKRLERNQAVLGQLFMWASVMGSGATLFRNAYPHLTFGPVARFDVPVGIDDPLWLKHEEPDQDAIDDVATLWDL